MPKISKFKFKKIDGNKKEIHFLSSDYEKSRKVHVTYVTGGNGSHKSSVLSAVASSLMSKNSEHEIEFLEKDQYDLSDLPIICSSGAVIDRFPIKEMSARRTEFDRPNYTYIGQRVNANLLSRKNVLEIFLQKSLDVKNFYKFKKRFFEKPFDLINIYPQFEIKLEPIISFEKFNKYSSKDQDILLNLRKMSNVGLNVNRVKPEQQFIRSMSEQMVKYLQEEFEYEIFLELENFFKGVFGKRRTLNLLISSKENPVCKDLSIQAIRLGLLLDVFRIKEFLVTPKSNGSAYSVLELSSGEFHMLVDLLAIGFAMSDNAIILIDEPESNLHPQWQQNFMEILYEIFGGYSNGHVLVSTHSPIIVGSAIIGNSIVDLSGESDVFQAISASIATSTDEVLLDQFNIGFSRNPRFMYLIQDAIELIERGEGSGDEFKKLVPDLEKIMNLLSKTDPLKRVIGAMINEVKG